jgi:glutathione-regulated potassium-efflux system ancillary protein KefG
MSAANRTLVVLGHPDLASSRINAALAETARNLPDVTLHDLYGSYPDLRLDIPREQELLVAHDHVVLQFPFYWYSVPPLLKQWIDEVFEYGFAYGSAGNALRGKTLRIATTTGGPAEAYRPGGTNRFTVTELLRPLDATAHLTGMRYQEPFVVHGARVVTDDELADHARRYGKLLEEGRYAPLA